MIEAYKKFWKNYVVFEGKSTRSDYWYTVLMNGLIILGFFILLIVSGGLTGLIAYAGGDSMTGGAVGFGILTFIIYFAMIIFGIAVFIPNLSLTIRRLRDAGQPWGFIFFTFIPFFGPIVLLVFMCMPSKENS
ncbi:DUF805 domain-containing protein [Lactobacillus sp. YT155]|uniref:DUF805 domain-containing protein n=1 Tax=Lactobacillus sp. YT155 TaxID=3060955 RepID=UPI00265E975D|nr:DUF805 domain-containing protein [Lactobacillus sp. YT155]MDO1605011.1 DUF805 domain-containing protein [Lactobacillus sp. YT155]